ncbi:hypothetical protein V6N12_027628 [Hibiscus sabdariffa]|uniref:Uncharacterized protein n=1 Tax=Hibiscus sabdariffa TaxID=183260 RepID=A0ABR2F3F2_9ROSI
MISVSLRTNEGILKAIFFGPVKGVGVVFAEFSAVKVVLEVFGKCLYAAAESLEVYNSGVGYSCTNIALDLRRKLQAWIDLRRGFEVEFASIMVDCMLSAGW